jgi:uncharacterized membrane-anchored protein YhcB (DUF1043 family)
MNYTSKFFLFFIVFLTIFFTLRTLGGDFYTIALQDQSGIGWLFSIIGLIFSILSGFLIQHLWDKWERVQKVVLEEIHALDHILMFGTHNDILAEQTKVLIRLYVQQVVDHEWSLKTRLLGSNEAIESLKILNNEFTTSETTHTQSKGALTKLINTLFYTRERRILLSTRRMPYIIKNTFLLSAVLVISLSLFVAISSVLFDLIFTLSIGSLVFAIYLIVDDMDNIMSPGAWHVSSKLYKEFLKKLD